MSKVSIMDVPKEEVFDLFRKFLDTATSGMVLVYKSKLAGIEWAGWDIGANLSCCPACGVRVNAENQHAETCWLAKAIYKEA